MFAMTQLPINASSLSRTGAGSQQGWNLPAVIFSPGNTAQSAQMRSTYSVVVHLPEPGAERG